MARYGEIHLLKFENLKNECRHALAESISVDNISIEQTSADTKDKPGYTRYDLNVDSYASVTILAPYEAVNTIRETLVEVYDSVHLPEDNWTRADEDYCKQRDGFVGQAIIAMLLGIAPQEDFLFKSQTSALPISDVAELAHAVAVMNADSLNLINPEMFFEADGDKIIKTEGPVMARSKQLIDQVETMAMHGHALQTFHNECLHDLSNLLATEILGLGEDLISEEIKSATSGAVGDSAIATIINIAKTSPQIQETIENTRYNCFIVACRDFAAKSRIRIKELTDVHASNLLQNKIAESLSTRAMNKLQQKTIAEAENHTKRLYRLAEDFVQRDGQSNILNTISQDDRGLFNLIAMDLHIRGILKNTAREMTHAIPLHKRIWNAAVRIVRAILSFIAGILWKSKEENQTLYQTNGAEEKFIEINLMRFEEVEAEIDSSNLSWDLGPFDSDMETYNRRIASSLPGNLHMFGNNISLRNPNRGMGWASTKSMQLDNDTGVKLNRATLQTLEDDTWNASEGRFDSPASSIISLVSIKKGNPLPSARSTPDLTLSADRTHENNAAMERSKSYYRLTGGIFIDEQSGNSSPDSGAEDLNTPSRHSRAKSIASDELEITAETNSSYTLGNRRPSTDEEIDREAAELMRNYLIIKSSANQNLSAAEALERYKNLLCTKTPTIDLQDSREQDRERFAFPYKATSNHLEELACDDQISAILNNRISFSSMHLSSLPSFDSSDDLHLPVATSKEYKKFAKDKAYTTTHKTLRDELADATSNYQEQNSCGTAINNKLTDSDTQKANTLLPPGVGHS